jgi:hypothetical protein
MRWKSIWRKNTPRRPTSETAPETLSVPPTQSRNEDDSDLPPLIYSSPGSRWVDPALGFDYKSAGLPHLY